MAKKDKQIARLARAVLKHLELMELDCMKCRNCVKRIIALATPPAAKGRRKA